MTNNYNIYHSYNILKYRWIDLKEKRMIHRSPSQLQNLLNLFLFINILSLHFPALSADMTNLSNQKSIGSGYVVGNITKSSGWYERYPNGQIVLYPIVTGISMDTTANMNSMLGMGSMYGMLGMGGMLGMSGMMGMAGMSPSMGGMPSMSSMAGMPSMNGMAGMPSMNGMAGMPSMNGMAGMPSMAGMSGMTGMYGMSAMSGMLGIASMYGIPPEGYQMTFGRFWIDKEGNLILYPSNNLFYMWGMNKTEDENHREAIKSMKDNNEETSVNDSVENKP
jgi:hypothetical protein